MNSRLQKLAEQAGFYGDPKFENLEKFAELVAEDIDSEAVRLIQFIANDYYELSHEKIKWQRDDHMKRCRKFLDNYFENNND